MFYSNKDLHLFLDKNVFAPKTHWDTINSRSITQIATAVFMDEKEKSM